jgi:predicted GIY-YIG superfamily endonuclease
MMARTRRMASLLSPWSAEGGWCGSWVSVAMPGLQQYFYPQVVSMRAMARAAKPARHHRHYVYVVELARGVLYERKFQKANVNYDPEKPCVYVGMTGLTPEVRFERHKHGVKSNKYVEKYGVRLLPQLYEVFNPMPYAAAQEMEVDLAISLREKGYGVWQG